MNKNLMDSFGRRIDYLRLSVTDRCDLRCTYCMPRGFKGFAEPENWLTFDEIERLVRIFAALGVNKVRLTGGEPLLRRGLPRLAARLSSIDGINDLSLSTNGTQLARHAASLRKAGVGRVNVSLDSLDRSRFQRIAGRDALPHILEGLQQAKAARFELIKINMVAMRGVNDDEIDDMVIFCMEHGFTLRLIEAMPMGDTGRSVKYLDLQPVRRRLQARFGLVDGVMPGGGPARYLQTTDGQFKVGFITPISQHFCTTCNRVRLAVDGTLHLCLGQEHQYRLQALLRGGATNIVLQRAVCAAIAAKPERHDFRNRPQKNVRFMSSLGG